MFEFINGTTCLKISPENGAIHSVTMNGKMVSSTSDRAFRIRLLAENGDYEMISDSDFQDFSLEGNTSLHWRKCRKFPGLEFMLKIRCSEYGSFLFRPSVTGIPSGFQLEWISAPVLGLPLDFETLYPHFEGFLQKAPPEAVHMEWESHFKFPGNCSYYPGDCQMQFLAAWSEGSGIYFAADDPGHSIKYFGTAHRAEAPVMETYMDCFCGTETPGQDYELPYDLILRPFSGDWQNACEIYREWIEQDPAIRREFPLPEWLKESPVVIICPVRGGKSITGLPNGFIPYENMFPRIRHLAEQFNSKVMVLLMRWDHNGPWMPPYYWPPVGGAESFRRFRDLLHSKGHLLGVYGSGTYFTLKGLVNDYSGEDIFRRENLAAAMVTGPHGEMESVFRPIRTQTAFCISEETSRHILEEQTKILADEKVDFFQILDQNLGGAPFPCYSKNHHHPSIPGRAGTDSMREFLRNLNALIRSRGSSMLLGTESAAAGPFIADLPFNDLRAHFAESTWSSPVPAYQFIFHRHLNNFFGNSCTVPNHTDDDCFRFRIARGFCGGSMMSVVLRDSGEIDWGASVCDWSEPVPDQQSIITLVRNLNEARRRYREFLQQGEMIPAPHIECNSREFTTLVLEGKVKTVPEILCSAWRAPDGREGAFFVNYMTQEKTFRRNGTTFTVPPLNVIMQEK